ncbi:hypothetical protein M2323_004641 [Rhodoblastus acidophilus]|uniref:hypothetical protein n=1 Tax=Rhodoblastus acidophilus TaxID=1074 RepID=UPI002224BF2F|nr:hypothetical protein [Rhodoblastus acidophilus]MCW2286837.1 hypothetical protein [Rhodoblastus acidophilus]MCW2335689.1 hypothetical protein [Rhodoblastus acidophilus]
MEDEVFEMGEFALDPERGAGVGKMGAFDPAVADRTGAQPLVEPGERVFGARQLSLLFPHFNRAKRRQSVEFVSSTSATRSRRYWLRPGATLQVWPPRPDFRAPRFYPPTPESSGASLIR